MSFSYKCSILGIYAESDSFDISGMINSILRAPLQVLLGERRILLKSAIIIIFHTC